MSEIHPRIEMPVLDWSDDGVSGLVPTGTVTLLLADVDPVKVDPIDLRMSSDHMDMHHSELLAAHTAANGAIEEAQAGWVGASAAALQTKLAEWLAVTTELCGDIAAHGEAFRSAAAGYESTDTDSAEKLDRQL